MTIAQQIKAIEQSIRELERDIRRNPQLQEDILADMRVQLEGLKAAIQTLQLLQSGGPTTSER